MSYRDYLQAPLQPLADNLESQTYEVFEKDATKYGTYEEAVSIVCPPFPPTFFNRLAALGTGICLGAPSRSCRQMSACRLSGCAGFPGPRRPRPRSEWNDGSHGGRRWAGPSGEGVAAGCCAREPEAEVSGTVDLFAIMLNSGWLLPTSSVPPTDAECTPSRRMSTQSCTYDACSSARSGRASSPSSLTTCGHGKRSLLSTAHSLLLMILDGCDLCQPLPLSRCLPVP